MERPLVTILTPVYNHEKYLDEYFTSIINQSYENIEIILIDDASKDRSKEIIEDWMERLKQRFIKITYINRKENKGLIANCNEGLQLSKGKYICLFASDDIMMTHNIKEKVKYLELNPIYAMVYSCAYTGRNFVKDNIEILGEKSEYGEMFESLLFNGNTIIAPSVLVKRQIMIDIGGYNKAYSFEDYPVWLEIAYKYKIGFINKALVFYRIVPGSLSRETSNYIKMISAQENILQHWQNKLNIDISKSFNNLYSMAAIYFFFNDQSKYLEYSNKIKVKEKKIKIYDILFFMRISPNLITYVIKLIKGIKK